jgi:GntR family transcriptional regulator
MDLTIDRHGLLPLHEQLTERIRQLVDGGELSAGDPLPTIREASERLGVNANTVAAAYRALEREGYLVQRKRAGTTVAEAPPRRIERALAGRLAAEAAERARAAGVPAADLVRAVAAQSVAPAPQAPLRVAVLAASAARAEELAERAGVALGKGVHCVPLTPERYASVDYHLTVVDPALTGRLSGRNEGRDASLPAHLAYGPEFPAAAD